MGDHTEMHYFLFFFFENVIRSYSEAKAETVGSIMGIGISRGRNTHPTNLEKEVKLRFNLPPLHILVKKFIPELVSESQTEYFRKEDGKKSHNAKFQIRKDLCLCWQLSMSSDQQKSFTYRFF